MGKMNKRLIVKVLITWVIFIPIPIINGVVRNFVYAPVVGELLAHQISTAIAVFTFLLLIFYRFKTEIMSLSEKTLFLIGLIWVTITVLFEFIFGYYVAGNSLDKLLADYNILAGRVWIIFLVAELLGLYMIKVIVSGGDLNGSKKERRI